MSFTEIEMIIKPTSPDGLIIYNGYTLDRKGDFVMLAMSGGHLEFRFDLGTGPAIIRYILALLLKYYQKNLHRMNFLFTCRDISIYIKLHDRLSQEYTFGLIFLSFKFKTVYIYIYKH